MKLEKIMPLQLPGKAMPNHVISGQRRLPLPFELLRFYSISSWPSLLVSDGSSDRRDAAKMLKKSSIGSLITIVVVSAGCASKPDTIALENGFGEAYELVNQASEASEYTAHRFTPYSAKTHPGVSDNAYRSNPCDGFDRDPVTLIDTDASCNRYKLDQSQFADGMTHLILGSLMPSGSDASGIFASAGIAFAQDIQVGGEGEGQIPDYLQDLSKEETQLLKMASSLERRKRIESVGLDKIGHVGSTSSRENGDAPNVPSNYVLGWLPREYADSPVEVIRRLEKQIASKAERMLLDRGYRLDPNAILLSLLSDYDSVTRAVFGPGCGEYKNEWDAHDDPAKFENYSKAAYATPCQFLVRIGYGGDHNRHASGIGNDYTQNDPSEIVELVTMPEKGLPERLSHLSGQKVWRINPEAAMEDLKLALYMPPTAQFDVESFYKSLSETLPSDVFFHVTFNEAFPVWTGKDLEMRGVPYMLDHGEELTYLKLGHAALQ